VPFFHKPIAKSTKNEYNIYSWTIFSHTRKKGCFLHRKHWNIGMNERLQKFYRDIAQKTVSVIGLGISNLPVIDFLLSCGADVVARDRKDETSLGAETVQALKDKGVRLRLGAEYLDDLCEDIIIKSPGIRPDLDEFKQATAKGSALTSEMELFLALCPATVFAVTGSDGKTTTTTLIYKMLARQCEREQSSRRVWVGGNIGRPLLPEIASVSEEDYVVLELSSFQLQAMKTGRQIAPWPYVACVTNVTPNHLNWHTDMAEYINAKTQIFQNQPCGGRLVLNYDNEITKGMAEHTHSQVTFFSSRSVPQVNNGNTAIYRADGQLFFRADKKEDPFSVLTVSDILVRGDHNIENFMTAIAAVRGYVDPDTITETARTFGGVEHRQEFVAEIDGIRYYNSSIDSSPTRTISALNAFDEKLIVILGGADKGVPFDSLAVPLAEHAKAVVITGAAREKICRALKENDAFTQANIPVAVEEDFLCAIDLARALASKGDTVILSPACTSFDAFPNFEVRGRTFKQHILQYRDQHTTQTPHEHE